MVFLVFPQILQTNFGIVHQIRPNIASFHNSEFINHLRSATLYNSRRNILLSLEDKFNSFLRNVQNAASHPKETRSLYFIDFRYIYIFFYFLYFPFMVYYQSMDMCCLCSTHSAVNTTRLMKRLHDV